MDTFILDSDSKSYFADLITIEGKKDISESIDASDTINFIKSLYIEFGAREFLEDTILAKLNGKMEPHERLTFISELRAFLTFGGMDYAPSKLLPLQLQLQDED
jgi:hypothetical protein